MTATSRRTRSWPVLLLTLPAFVAIWGGWVGLGGMTGFGVINLLPGMVDDGGWATVNTAVTLPIGLETYAAYALHAYTQAQSPELKRFAGRSAIVALVLGGSGQLAYHVMESLGVVVAPWWITAIVATIPVAVLGAGTRLSSLIRADATKQVESGDRAEQSDVATPVLTAAEMGHALSERIAERSATLPDAPPIVLPEQSAAEQVWRPLIDNYTERAEQHMEQSAADAVKQRRSRPASESLEKAVRALLAGGTVDDAAATHGIGASTLRRYAAVQRILRDNPLADDFGSATGRVKPDLVAIIRDDANRGRVR